MRSFFEWSTRWRRHREEAENFEKIKIAYNIKEDMKISSKGIEFIKGWEGSRNKAYKDVAGLWTIGIGHLIKDNEQHLITATLDDEMVAALFRKDVEPTEKAVEKYVKVSINQNQFDTLCSFIFNCGSGNFSKSTLLKVINSGGSEQEIREQFLRWNKAGGVFVQGLMNRRLEEADYYFRK